MSFTVKPYDNQVKLTFHKQNELFEISNLKDRGITAFTKDTWSLKFRLLEVVYLSPQKDVQWSKFKVKKGIVLRNLPTASVNKLKWYNKIITAIKNFFSPDVPEWKIRALKAWHDPEKLKTAYYNNYKLIAPRTKNRK